MVTSEVEVEAALRRVQASPQKANGEKAIDPKALFKLAGKLLRQFKVSEAIEIYEALSSDTEARAEARTGLGWCFLSLRDFDRAAQFFEAALDIEPDLGRALYGAGLALLEIGHLAESASYARRLIGMQNKEERARGLYVLGLTDRARGAWDEAVEHLEESLRLDPRDHDRPNWTEVRHRYELALCYRELNQLDRALVHLRWAARHERKPGPIALDLAFIYLDLDRFEEAEDKFQTVLKHNPENRQALIGLGRVHLRRGDFRAAIKRFSEVLARAADDIDALTGMAAGYKGLGDLDKAAGYSEQLRRLYKTPHAQLEARLRALENERQMRDAELLRMRNIAALNIMATGIAHELRQPLSLIRLAAQNARQDLKRGITTSVDEDLRDIDTGVVRLDKIINVLREVASDEATNDEVFSIDDAIEASLALFRTQLAHRGIDLVVRGAHGAHALGSRAALQQVLVNLISNARDALAEASEKRIEIDVEEKRDKVLLRVKDTGCGMSEVVKERALEPFYTTKQNGGMGLGLYFGHNLMRRMRGTLRIRDSSIGRGTTFEVELRNAREAQRG